MTLEPFGIENPDLVPIQFLRFVAKFRAHDAVDQDVEGRVGHLKVCRNCSLHFVSMIVGLFKSLPSAISPSLFAII